MADFCKQCAERVFGKGTPSDFERPDGHSEQRFEELCEGCGLTEVDHDGFCVSPSCYLHSDDAPAREG